MTFDQLVSYAARLGYTIELEDRSLTDSTPVIAIYQRGVRLARFATIAAAVKYFG